MCIDQYASIARLDGYTVVAMQQERSVINNYVTIKLCRTHCCTLDALRADGCSLA
ncbi:hypothetical protein IG631_17442 [Alternaria alternata]|nr:hypothetical protein IG631_17442 [Alternaria alternata]